MDNCKKFNLNYYVYVQLTSFGKKVLYEYYKKAGVSQVSVRKLYKMKNSIIQIQLWELAHIFGKKLYNGAVDSPFENSFIFIPEENLE